jgi:hypothetical protein
LKENVIFNIEESMDSYILPSMWVLLLPKNCFKRGMPKSA